MSQECSAATDSGYCAVVPTYNNRGTVGNVVLGVLKTVETCIVVDDGCTDGTVEMLRERFAAEFENGRLLLVAHPRNRGKGVALRTGFKKAKALGYSHAVTIDSDGQHFPDEIGKLLAVSREDPDAFVIGVRDMSGEHVPGASSFGRMFSNFWLKVATGRDVGDTQSGFRVYPLRHVARIRCIGRRFTYECEVIIRAAWGGCPIRNVPVRVYYPPKAERVSHFNPLWDNVRFTALYLYACFGHLLVPIPHRRLVRRSEPLWAGSWGASIAGLWHRLREAAALPDEARLSGGPIKRTRQMIRLIAFEKNTPGELGLAVAIGAFLGCTPLVGFHWLLALYAATRVHLNRLACLAATNVSFGPLVFVFAVASIALGKLMTGHPFAPPPTLSMAAFHHYVSSSLLEWALGSIVIGLAMAFATGLATLYGVRALRRTEAGRRDESESPVDSGTDGPLQLIPGAEVEAA